MNGYTANCATCGKQKHRGALNGYGDCGPCATAKQNAKNFPKTFDLSAGDKVSITLPNGQCYTGVVISANHWDIHSGWYIELTHQNGYGYWKQGCDGGTVMKLDAERTASQMRGRGPTPTGMISHSESHHPGNPCRPGCTGYKAGVQS